MRRKDAKLSTETKKLIVTLSQSGKTKRNCQDCWTFQERLCCLCFKQVSKDWHSGDFDAKWKKKELHK